MSVVTVSYVRNDEQQSWTAVPSGSLGSGMTAQSVSLLQKLVSEALQREGFKKAATIQLSDQQIEDRWEALVADE